MVLSQRQILIVSVGKNFERASFGCKRSKTARVASDRKDILARKYLEAAELTRVACSNSPRFAVIHALAYLWILQIPQTPRMQMLQAVENPAPSREQGSTASGRGYRMEKSCTAPRHMELSDVANPRPSGTARKYKGQLVAMS
jgi:hypothetical protein